MVELWGWRLSSGRVSVSERHNVRHRPPAPANASATTILTSPASSIQGFAALPRKRASSSTCRLNFRVRAMELAKGTSASRLGNGVNCPAGTSRNTILARIQDGNEQDTCNSFCGDIWGSWTRPPMRMRYLLSHVLALCLVHTASPTEFA